MRAEFRELAQRSGQYQIINQGDVREGELNGRNRLTGEIDFIWNENDAEREKMPIIGYFSYFRLSNGFASTLYMSKEEVTNHGKRYSQSFKRGYGPWVDNYDAMALKTVSKLNISKNGPLSVDLQKAVTVDQAVIHDDNKLEYVDGDELLNVGADEDKKAAIIAANSEDNSASDANDVADADMSEEQLAANMDKASEQATLIDEPKATNHGDNPQRRSTGKR